MEPNDRPMQLARRWHELYCQVAPSYGYAESEWSRPWIDLDDTARRCMVALAGRMLAEMDNARLHGLVYP